MKLIKTTVLDASAASVTISNIPQEFKTLRLWISARSSLGASAENIQIALNGSSSSITVRRLYGDGGAAYSDNDSLARIGIMPASTSTSNTFSNADVVFPNYSSTTANKPFASSMVEEKNATASYLTMSALLLSSNSAITSLTLTPYSAGSFVAGSTFYLYGIA